MVLLVGQIVILGGWMGDVAVPTPAVLKLATFWLYIDPE
jgi:hypothetical protein